MSGLNPNRYAAPAEAALLREHIAQDEAAQPVIQQRVSRARTALHDALHALREAQEAVDSAQRIHDEVLAIRDALDTRLRSARGLLHPIRRVPNEVLSMIFLNLLGAERERRYTVGLSVAGVCTCWREVALSMPSLWSSI
ncbi:hypothetical protein AURDEDRAFT_67767, partial [Auricularia subglabra TFB-10046 SS5]